MKVINFYVSSSGTKEWYLKGKRHREDGPAIEYSNGDKEWWENDKLHREDGPAIERPDGSEEWWKNGMYFVKKKVKENYYRSSTVLLVY